MYDEFLKTNYNNAGFLTSDFEKPILFNPATIEHGYNNLKIITAFTDCERISTHMIALSDGIKAKKYVNDISVDIILGMSKSSISLKKHNEICRLLRYLNSTKGMPHVSCNYINSGPEVHSKVYIWGKDLNMPNSFPEMAYCGSLNYTMNAFYKRRETLVPCNPLEAYNYYETLLNDSIDCHDPQALERIKNVTNETQADAFEPDDLDYTIYNQKQPIATLEVSLLRADGSDTGIGSGINWGIRPNGTKRNRNQAYIPYNKQDRKPDFFPDRENPNDPNCPIFKVITKDFGTFHMRMAQQGNKALHSAESNAILGEWLRHQMGLRDGDLITKQMLEKYGKTYVTFRKYDDGTYLLDF